MTVQSSIVRIKLIIGEADCMVFRGHGHQRSLEQTAVVMLGLAAGHILVIVL